MNKSDMASLLEAIADRVIGDGRPGSGTAPVEISIGYIAKTRMCLQDGIVITSSPSAVTDTVIKWVKATNEDDPDATPIMMEPGCGGLIIH